MIYYEQIKNYNVYKHEDLLADFLKQTYNIKEALQAAVQWTGSDILCCCGSLYLAGSIKEILL